MSHPYRRWDTQGEVVHSGLPPCSTQGTDHTHSKMPKPWMAGTKEEWRGNNN